MRALARTMEGVPHTLGALDWDTPLCGIDVRRAANVVNLHAPGCVRGLFSLPLLVPYISLGVGVASFFYAVRLTGSFAAVVFAHVIAALPFGVTIIASAIQELAPELEEAARACGASPWTAFRRVTLPLLVPALLAQAGYVFMLSMHEFTLTLLVSSPETSTLPVQMYAAIGEGYLQVSSALAMLLLIPSVALSYLIARYLRADLTAAH